MEKTNGLSVIVITRNEEEALPGCLGSVKNIADEIVLVDSGSTDRTLEVAQSYTQKIYHRDWVGYSSQKQYALEKSSGLWVLNIDADEQVTPELAAEIRQVIQDPSKFPSGANQLDKPASNGLQPNGFEIPFKHFFCGKRLRFGGVQGETHLRLFKRDLSKYGDQTVHESIQVEPPIGRLQNFILHYSYNNIHDYLTKCNDYTTMIAKEKKSKGEQFHWWHHLRLPWEFVIRYFFKLGFLDGPQGLTYALLSSYYVWLKFVKLKDLEAQAK